MALSSNRSFDFVDIGNTWPDLTGATGTFAIGGPPSPYGAPLSIPVTFLVRSGANKSVRVELTSAQSASLQPTNLPTKLRFTLADGNVVTVLEGQAIVSP